MNWRLAYSLASLAWLILYVDVSVAQTFQEILDDYPEARVILADVTITVYERTDTGSLPVHTFAWGDTLLVFHPSGSFFRAASPARGFLGFVLKDRVDAIHEVQSPRYKIIARADAPLKIVRYRAEYQNHNSNEGIRHTIFYENVSGRQLVAARFGLVSFSVFNEFIDFSAGVDMTPAGPGASQESSWLIRFEPSDFTFYTGVVFVTKVRFENDEIWEADLGTIVETLREIEKTFDSSRLKPRRPGDR